MGLKGLLARIFHGKNNIKAEVKGFDLSEVIRKMFLEAGVGYEQPQPNVFVTEIGGTNCNFKTVLRCNDENRNKIFIYAPFPIPVPKHYVGMVQNELICINKANTYKSEITIQEVGNENTILAFTDYEFDHTPTSDEIKNLMIHTIDIMDSDNFRSISCAIFGFPSYDELENVMLNNSSQQGNQLNINFKDGYSSLHEAAQNTSATRYAGRLLALSLHIIREKVSAEIAGQMLERQTPISEVMQTAYEVADEKERDVLRKLRYLIVYKKVIDKDSSDNEADGIIGQTEADKMIEHDIYSLL